MECIYGKQICRKYYELDVLLVLVIVFQDYLSPNAHCMEIPRLSSTDYYAIFTSFPQHSQCALPDVTSRKLYQQVEGVCTPLLLQVIAVYCEAACPDADHCPDISPSLDDMIHKLLQLAETRYGVSHATVFCCLLVCTNEGVSVGEFADVASCDASVRDECWGWGCGSGKRVSCLQWYALVTLFSPFLYSYVTSHGTGPLYRWKHASFEHVCKARYARRIPDMLETLNAYWTNTMQVEHDSLGISSDVANHRLLGELLHSYHMIGQTPTGVITAQYILALLDSKGIVAALLDLSQRAHCGQMELLVEILQHLKDALLLTSRSFFTHFHQYITFNHLSLEAYPLPTDLFNMAEAQLPTLLIPLYGLGSFSLGYCASEPRCCYTNTGIFRIKGDDDHVVVTALNNSELKIFNFHTQLNHRLLKGTTSSVMPSYMCTYCALFKFNLSISSFHHVRRICMYFLRTSAYRDVTLPRDVKVINMSKAVVLCDRELQVYDLDKGRLHCKLQGILNLRMPYFGIHDDNHTMAMARNRMYVNMLHNRTGDVITTFKVSIIEFI